MSYYRYQDRPKRTLSDWPHLLATFSICLICWMMGYIYSIGFPLTVNNSILPLWKHLCDYISNRAIVYFLGLILTALIAIVIFRINEIEMLNRERTRLVFMFIVLLMSTNAGLLPFNEVTIVLLCFVCMIHELFTAYQLPDESGKSFNVGVFIGIAGLFLPQVLWLIPLVWIGMYQFYSLSFRSFMASLIGVLIIFWFVLAWCVWIHDFSMFTSLFYTLTNIKLFSIFLTFRYHHIGFFMIIILLLATFLHIKTDAISNRVRVRQMHSFLINMVIGSLLLICLFGGDAESFLAVLYLPTSVLLAYFFENMHIRFRFLLYYFILTINFFSFILQIWKY